MAYPLRICPADLLGLCMLWGGSSPQAGDTMRPAPTADMDSGVIARARGGRADAQAALVGALQDVWYRYTLSLLRDPEQARDATQETALRFLRSLRRFNGGSSLKTWSLGIATNVCRERRRQRQHQTLPTEPGKADTLPGPSQQVELREQRDRLLLVLGDLPDRQHEAVVLRYLEQLSVRDTAAVMGCAEGTVKATLSQALRSLRQRLGADHG